MARELRISLLGELSVMLDGEAIELPNSRKARALLAYCALTGRPQRRERLCEMFWDLPDDPRASLRWALSKLRSALNRDGFEPLQADRERIWFDNSQAAVDYLQYRDRAAEMIAGPDIPALTRAANDLSKPLLEGLDLPRLDTFRTWLTAERDEAAALQAEILRSLSIAEETSPQNALAWARRWEAACPLDPDAVTTLAMRLRQAGKAEEARHFETEVRTRFREAELPEPATHGDVKPHAQDALKLAPSEPEALRRQKISICRTSDGVRIACAEVGDGPVLVKAANWLNHVELDWSSPLWGGTLQSLSRSFRLVRYDSRGQGLSDWDAAALDFPGFVADLEAVTDSYDLQRFPIIGHSQGCPVAIEYAARHPERVSGLILIGGFARGWKFPEWGDASEKIGAISTLTEHGWEIDDPAFRRIFSQIFMPSATPEEIEWLDAFMRHAVSARNVAGLLNAMGDVDVSRHLPNLTCPVLVLHSARDMNVPISLGRELAARIPDARFSSLNSTNHVLKTGEPAWRVMMDEITAFVGGLRY